MGQDVGEGGVTLVVEAKSGPWVGVRGPLCYFFFLQHAPPFAAQAPSAAGGMSGGGCLSGGGWAKPVRQVHQKAAARCQAQGLGLASSERRGKGKKISASTN